MSRPKEPQFFSNEQKYARGDGWYRALFAGAVEGQIRGECSTCYSRWPHHGNVAERIARALPDVKLIYLMRHPVERAFSHYRHQVRHRHHPIAFGRAMEEEPEIIDASLYAVQIERYLRHFERDRLLLLTFDDLVSDPGGVLGRVQRFLGVEARDLGVEASERYNQADQAVAVARTTRMVYALRFAARRARLPRVVPAAARDRLVYAATRVGRMRVWHRRAIAQHNRLRETLTPDLRCRLLDRLDDSTRQLEAMMDRDLSAWRR